MSFTKGTFVISLDTEMAWGRINEKENKEYYHLHRQTKKVIQRLIDLFDEYNAPATWAIVGRLIDTLGDSSDKELEEFYQELNNRAVYQNPELHKKEDSILVFPEIMELLAKSKVRHEIASHSYNHILFGGSNPATEPQALRDILLENEVLGHYNTKAETVVFPRNLVGHQKLFQANGYKIFRGTESTWIENWPPVLHKPLRQIDAFFPIAPSVVLPKRDNGWINLPSSLVFRARSVGWKKNLPISWLEKKALKGIDNAAKTGKVFHIFFHPFNFAFREDEHFNALRNLLLATQRLVSDEKMEILTMKDAAVKYLGNIN